MLKNQYIEPSLQEELIKHAGNRMAAEIDFEILCGLLVDIGWHKVILRPMTGETSTELDAWVEHHVQGHYHTMGLVFVFEDYKDANWFTLRWG